MPPSGYTKKQSDFIISFLESVSFSLKEEGEELKLTPIEALKREIKNIDDIVKSEQFNDISNIVLELTKWLYNCLLDKTPKNYDFFLEYRDDILKHVDLSILDIHVPSIKQTID